MFKNGFAAVYVSNIQNSVNFYTNVLELVLVDHSSEHFALLTVGEAFQVGLRLVSQRTPPPGSAGSVAVGLQVEGELEDTVSLLEERGVEFVGPIVGPPSFRMAFFNDPDKNRVFLYAQ